MDACLLFVLDLVFQFLSAMYWLVRTYLKLSILSQWDVKPELIESVNWHVWHKPCRRCDIVLFEVCQTTFISLVSLYDIDTFKITKQSNKILYKTFIS